MTWLTVVSLLKRVPRQVWALMALVALMASLIAWSEARRRAAYRAGRADVQREAVAVAPAQRETVRVVTVRTDTLIRRVVERITDVESLVVAVPESIRVAVPSVDTALKACRALAQDCDAMRAGFLVERAARESLAVQLGVVTTAQADTIRTLNKRPRWRTVLGAVAVGVVGGMVAR